MPRKKTRTKEVNMFGLAAASDSADTTTTTTPSQKYGRFNPSVILKADGSNYTNWAGFLEVLIRAEKDTYWKLITVGGMPALDAAPAEEFIRYIILHSINPVIIQRLYQGKTETEKETLTKAK